MNKLLITLGYFIEQKFKETWGWLALGPFVYLLSASMANTDGWQCKTLMWIICIILVCSLLAMLVLLFVLFCGWIADNWKLANERADKKLKEKR